MASNDLLLADVFNVTAFSINISAGNIYDGDESFRVAMFVTAVVVPIIFGLIFCVGVVGNLLLIYTVLRNKAMRTNPNVFLVSMAIGDFLLLLVSVPFTATLYTLPEWSYGVALCKLNEGMQTLSLGVSIFTLTAVSGDRFIAVVYPIVSYKWSTLRRTLQICAVLWVFSIALAIPDVVIADVSVYTSENPFRICDAHPDEWGIWYVKFRTLLRFVVFFVIPILIITTMYTLIAKTLLHGPQLEPGGRGGGGGTASNMSAAWAKQMHTRKKISKMVLCIVVLFAVCWFPRYVFHMTFFFTDMEYNEFVHFSKITVFCLSFAYSCVNPVALYIISDEFRRYFDHYLFGCCCKSRRLKRRRGTGYLDPGVGLPMSHTMNGGRLVGSHSRLNFTPGTTPNMSLEDITRA